MTGAHISQNLKDQKTFKQKKIQVLCEYELEHLKVQSDQKTE